MDDKPGDFGFFLSRANINELLEARAREVEKGKLLTRWRVVMEIDQEIDRRNEALRKALST